MRILVALGGNALLRRSVAVAAAAVAKLAREHEVMLTHGNGRRAGMVGHVLELALRNQLPERDVVSVLTEVVIAAGDPALLKPSQPIGPVYDERRAQRLRLDRGWTMGREGGGYRRLVPSPEPHAIAEVRSLRALIDAGALVVCAGGGVPVILDGMGTMHGVEAVVDKDLTAALLARRLDADLLLMLTDVGAAAGSMAPKVEAASRFAEATGRRAAIGALPDAVRVARGEAGTQVVAPAAAPAIAAARRLRPN